MYRIGDSYPKLNNKEWLLELAFFCDTTETLYNLNIDYKEVIKNNNSYKHFEVIQRNIKYANNATVTSGRLGQTGSKIEKTT